MKHRLAAEIDWVDAPVEDFTGTVKFGPLSQDGALDALAVRFEPGARTDWHWHPEGQVLYVTEGVGLVQDDDGTTVEISAGDTVFTPANQVHWHGAGPSAPMAHLSFTTGGATVWEQRKVTDEEYHSRG